MLCQRSRSSGVPDPGDAQIGFSFDPEDAQVRRP
jgi:hypothetical protein